MSDLRKFPKRVLPETAEQVLLQSPPRLDGIECVIDLSQSEFFEPTSIVSIVAGSHALRAARPDLVFRLHLPRKRKTRDFLRRWRFGSTIERVLGANPDESQLLSDASTVYQSEVSEGFQDYAPARVPDQHGELQALTSLRFFNTQAKVIPDEPSAAAKVAPDERRRWESPEIEAILERHLGRKAYLVPPTIIYEAVLNATMHPGADRFVALSHLNTKAHRKYPHGLLTITIWDNGRSILSTLKSAESEGRRLRTEEYEHYYDWYSCYDKPKGVKSWRHLEDLYSGDDVATYTEQRQLLIASTYPGISSAHGRPRPVGGGKEFLGRDWGKTGMGLWILSSTVVDSFGGEVGVRAGDMFVNLKRSMGEDQTKRRTRYRCNTVETRSAVPFVGNQIIARIPLIEESKA